LVWALQFRRLKIPAGNRTDEEGQKRTGVLIGSGIGGLPEIETTFIHNERRWLEKTKSVLHSCVPDKPCIRPCFNEV
jgi:3-oxoacyl-(acyl-carrier-protein) synthase